MRPGARYRGLYDSVIERNDRKRRFPAVEVRDCFLVRPIGQPAPISIYRHPAGPFIGGADHFGPTDDSALSVTLRLNGYAVAPLDWYRERGVDPVAMRDAGAEYRETFFSIMRRLWRRRAEYLWRLRHPTGKRAIHVEAV
ncbi:MAG TPA: hypothetical protein VKA60_27630 [Blastocatellia bacterium]|nr:hypothetical protein [Blastocatellia bacterium]